MTGTSQRAHEITLAKQRAAHALVTSKTISEAAAKADVARETLSRWVNGDPAFRSLVTEFERERFSEIAREFMRLADTALDTLRAAMTNPPKRNPGVRVRAAECVINNLLRLREFAEIESRIAALEAAARGGIGNALN